jgi:hypothetical protein
MITNYPCLRNDQQIVWICILKDREDAPSEDWSYHYKNLQFPHGHFLSGRRFQISPKGRPYLSVPFISYLSIEDLYEYVHSYHKTYNTDLFGDPSKPQPPADPFLIPNPIIESEPFPYDPNGSPLLPDYLIPDEHQNTVRSANGFPRTDTATSAKSTDTESFTILDKFKLFAVFDGHCGKFAASYLQYRFPFELCGSDLFKAGKYEDALRATYDSMHTLLKNCSKYGPERPYVLNPLY